MDNKLFDEESLRLLKAFFSLRDPDVRATIVKLVEDCASGARIPDVAAGERKLNG